MSINYFCSGFDKKNAFFPLLGEQLKKDLKGTKSIVYIPRSNDQEKVKNTLMRFVPIFTEHFKNIGVVFDNVYSITPDMDYETAKKLVQESDMVMLMGGNPFKQQELYSSKGLTEVLQNYDGVILGFSSGAMNMSKYIIITPCSSEYPDFDIREGLNLSGISIYPHNNFEGDVFPLKVEAEGM